MVLTSSSVLEDVVDVKRQQLALLFSVWDNDASGRVHVQHVAPILRAVFACADDDEIFSTARIRGVYTQVTGRGWQASQHAPLCYGPTQQDMMAMADLLGADLSSGGETTPGQGALALARRSVNAELAQLVSDAQAASTSESAAVSFAGQTFTHAEWRAVSGLVTASTEGAASTNGDLVDGFFASA